jgi:hypothetical protein
MNIPPKATTLPRHSAQALLPFAIFVAGFITIVAWFKGFDLYHTDFEASGVLIVLYNIFRVLFVFYLFWIVQVVGSFSLRLIAGDAWNSINALDQLALGFFAGAGIWHVFLLTLGLLNLYTVPVAIFITLPIVALSYRNVRATVDFARQFVTTHRESAWAWLHLPLALACLAVSCALILVKGLYPAGGHDYFTHYFYYYQAVIDNAGLRPNEVWYHYYYSKGAGLYFLGILLTDPLAPQLVTLCFFAASALALFQFLRRIAPNTIWPSVGIIIYLGLYIYTPGRGQYLANGGWADFEKLHELNTALLVSTLWLVASALERSGRIALTWASAAASATIAAIIINPTIAPYIGSTLGLAGIWFFVSRRLASGVICIGLAAVAGAAVSAIFTINYLTTGLINDQGILLFWQFADLERLYRWGALPLAIIVHWSTTGMVANSVPLTFDTIVFLALTLRLDLLFPLLGLGLMTAAGAIFTKRVRIVARHDFLVLTIAILVFVVFCVAAGRSQSISFYRYSSFVVPIMIAEGIALCAIFDASGTNRLTKAAGSVLLPLAVLVGCFFAAYSIYPDGRFSTVVMNAWRFAKGTYSIDNAYTAQDGWPGRLPWGAIYPGARGAYAVVGPHTPVWTFHIHTYCMLPDCRFQHHAPFIMAGDLDRVLFGTPEEGMKILQAAGHNYFLFSRELPMNDWITLAPLFSPDNISRFLGIRWTDGTTALLTWLGPDTVPLDQSWLADYRKAVTTSPTVQSYPFAAMRKIYERLRATPHPWRSFELPWEGNRPY